MTYMLLIVEPHGQRQQRTEAEGRAAYARMVAFGDDLRKRGLLTASESLESPSGAVRVRTSGGKSHLTDGPFTESKEFVGGFFLLTCKTREEAVQIAAQCPAAEWCDVEVRQLAPCYA
jgi:hypothetical protein